MRSSPSGLPIAKTRSPDRQRIGAAQRHVLEPGRVFVLHLQQRQVGKLVQGNNANLLVGLAVELAILLVIDLHRDLRLALDDVEIGDEESVFVEEEARAEAARGADLDHGFADLIHQLEHGADRRRLAGGRVETGIGFGKLRSGGGGGLWPARTAWRRAPGCRSLRIVTTWLRGMTSTV